MHQLNERDVALPLKISTTAIRRLLWLGTVGHAAAIRHRRHADLRATALHKVPDFHGPHGTGDSSVNGIRATSGETWLVRPQSTKLSSTFRAYLRAGREQPVDLWLQDARDRPT